VKSLKSIQRIAFISLFLASSWAQSEAGVGHINQGAQGNMGYNPYSGSNLLIVPNIPNQPQNSVIANGPNGLVTTQSGNTTYYSNGPSSITNGNKTIYSNGKSCITNGSKTTCN